MIKELFRAAQTGDSQRVKELLEEDASYANAENEEGLTVLGYAAHFGHADVVALLLDNGADLQALSHSKVSYIPSNTALHAAIAGEGSMEVIRHLLERGAQTDICDSNGHTCLHTAAFHDDRVEVIRMLIAYGAQVNERAKNEGQLTPLKLALEKGNANVAELLRQHGAV
ncbi:ankyrin repeat domain-containing protein [Brevibacillus choshinensis]